MSTKTYVVERLCAFLVRRLNQVGAHDVLPSRVLVRRLDTHLRQRIPQRRRFSTTPVQRFSILTDSETTQPNNFALQGIPERRKQEVVDVQKTTFGLPQSCPGCGALTQESEPLQAGYYSSTRRIIKRYLRKQRALQRAQTNHEAGQLGEIPSEDVVEEGLKIAQEQDLKQDQEQEKNQESDENPDKDENAATPVIRTPYCDRCHDLVHNSRGVSISHPTIDSIADSIAESPFKRNHIYHVVDAADFPMSVVPEIFNRLALARPRSQNRRSQHDFSTKPTMSFIITRSDLLGPTKEIVDETMTFFQNVLRQALGRAGRDMRLGNVHLVSAKRGWWTKDIKEDIWKRGGGNWMMGKVNVGKSNLFEVLFPKGSGERAPVYEELRKKEDHITEQSNTSKVALPGALLSEDSLLPPAQVEEPFPVMPIVSSLPGTTASPIRLPFAGGRGELIDLPGLERGNLEDYVRREHKSDLVMTHRQNVEQHTIKSGQSLLLGGGLVRITPHLEPGDRNTTVLAYPFVPLKAHVTSTDKAILQQSQARQSGIESVLEEDVGMHMMSAGTFSLNTDITKARSGALLRAGVDMSKLPYRVYSTDILLEGVGWVELVCQVRRSRRISQSTPLLVAHENQETSTTSESPVTTETSEFEPDFAPFAKQPPLEKETLERERTIEFPTIEVFSPKGRYVAQRPCLQAWTRWNGDRKKKSSPSQSRRPHRPTKRTR